MGKGGNRYQIRVTDCLEFVMFAKKYMPMFLLRSYLALGRLLDNEKAIELCHSKLIEDLSNDDSTAHGLEMVIKLNFVSDYLINLMLKCFKSDRGMTRTQICETVTVRVYNDNLFHPIIG